MNDDSMLGQELLKQDGLSSPKRLEQEWQELRGLLESDRKRAKLVKKLACFFLALGVMCFIGFFAVGIPVSILYDPLPVSFLGELLTEGLPIIGAWSTGLSIAIGLFWFVFSRMVDIHAMKVRLATMEMHLRSDVKDDSK